MAPARAVLAFSLLTACPGLASADPRIDHDASEATGGGVQTLSALSFEGCSHFLKQLDWNQNVTDEDWRTKLGSVVQCIKHTEVLARDAGPEREPAYGGIHTPTTITPVMIEDMPEFPPLTYVLPLWDMVVSNMMRLTGAYDLQELDVLRRLTPKGGAFVDIGANVGAVTVPMGAFVGREGVVYSFEPFRQVFQYLNANVAINGLANVHTFHCALSAEAKTGVRVPAPSLMHGQNAGMFGVFQQDSGAIPNKPESAPRDPPEEITIRTLDSFELPRVDIIKIDVEGHAPEVLAGSLETLQRHRPTIWFEGGAEWQPETLLREQLDYRCARLTETTEEQWLCGPAERFQDIWGSLH